MRDPNEDPGPPTGTPPPGAPPPGEDPNDKTKRLAALMAWWEKTYPLAFKAGGANRFTFDWTKSDKELQDQIKQFSYQDTDPNRYHPGGNRDPTTGNLKPGGGPGGNIFDPTTMGDLIAPFTDTFTAPNPVWSWEDAPGFKAPVYNAPDPFSYADFQKPADFQAPNAEEALNDPGYKFRLDQGEKALMNSKLAQGTGRTGGTMQDMLDYGQKAASSEYQNVYARRKGEYDTTVANDLTAWGTNYRKAADTWASNTKEGLDAYDRLFQGAMAEFGPKMASWQGKTQWGPQQNQQNYNNAWNQYLTKYDIFKHNEEWPWQVLKDSATTGAGGL